jgi:hypothetical protein
VQYLLHIEDSVGGPDSNAYTMICTYVNATTLTAVYFIPGDAILTGSVIVYLTNPYGTSSNQLNGTAAGTVITI